MSNAEADGRGEGSPLDPVREFLAPFDDAMTEAIDWYPIARKEVFDTLRSWQFIALTILFLFFFHIPVFYMFGAEFLVENADILQNTNQAISLIKNVASVFVPIIAVIIGYAAISREHDSGSLKILLSLPYTRRDVILGKFVGRSAVVAIPILLGLVISFVTFAIAGLEIIIVPWVAFTLLTLFLGVVFSGFSVGISAGLETNFRSMLVSMLSVVGIGFVWGLAVNNVLGIALRQMEVESVTRLKSQFALQILDPTVAYQTLIDSALEGQLQARAIVFPRGFLSPINPTGCEEILAGTLTRTQTGNIVCQDGSVMFWATDPAVFLYMVLWLVVPLAVGYYFFEGRDL